MVEICQRLSGALSCPRSAAFTQQKRPLATIVTDIRKISPLQCLCGLKSARLSGLRPNTHEVIRVLKNAFDIMLFRLDSKS